MHFEFYHLSSRCNKCLRLKHFQQPHIQSQCLWRRHLHAWTSWISKRFQHEWKQHIQVLWILCCKWGWERARVALPRQGEHKNERESRNGNWTFDVWNSRPPLCYLLTGPVSGLRVGTVTDPEQDPFCFLIQKYSPNSDLVAYRN